MKYYLRRYKGRIILGIIRSVLFILFYLSVTSNRETTAIKNSSCELLRTTALCAQNDKCYWTDGANFCCANGTYATENAFGKKICCVNGQTCD